MSRQKKFPLPKLVKVELDIDEVPNLATEKATLPQLEVWNKEIVASISECTSSRDVKNFLSILRKYAKFLRKDHTKCWNRVVFIKSIQRHIMAMSDYFSAHTENIKYEFDYVFYITKIIGLYCTLELDVHRNAFGQVSDKCDFVTSVTNRLLGLMFVSLNFTSGRVADVLLRIDYSRTNKFHSAVMTRLYHHCLLTIPLETTSYAAFYSYYLNFQDMQELTPKHLRTEQKKYLLQSFGKTQEEVKDDLILKKILEAPARSTVKTVEHIAFPRKTTTRSYFKYLQSTQTCHVPNDRNITDMMESVGLTSDGDGKSANFESTFNFTDGLHSSSESEGDSEHENIICEIDIDSDFEEITYVQKQPPRRKERHKKKQSKRDESNSKKTSVASSEVIILDSSEEEEEITPPPQANPSIFSNDNYTQTMFNNFEYTSLIADFTTPEFHHGLATPPRERCGLFEDNHIIEHEQDCEEQGIFESYNKRGEFDSHNNMEVDLSDKYQEVNKPDIVQNEMIQLETTVEAERQQEHENQSDILCEESHNIEAEKNSESLQNKSDQDERIESSILETNGNEESKKDDEVITTLGDKENVRENDDLAVDNKSADCTDNNSAGVEENNSLIGNDELNQSDFPMDSNNKSTVDSQLLSKEASEDVYQAEDDERTEVIDEELITSDKVAEIIYGKPSENFVRITEDIEETNPPETNEDSIRDSPENLLKISEDQHEDTINRTSEDMVNMEVDYDNTSEGSYTITGGNVSVNVESPTEEIEKLTLKEKVDKLTELSPRVLYTSTVEEFDQFEARINQSKEVGQFAESCSEIDAFLSGPIESNRMSDQYYGDNDLPAGDLFALVNTGLKGVLPHVNLPLKIGAPKSGKSKRDGNTNDTSTVKVKKVTFSADISPEPVFDPPIETFERRGDSPTPSPVFEKWQKRYTGEFKKVLKDINRAADTAGFPQFEDVSKTVTFSDHVQMKFIPPRPAVTSNSFVFRNGVKCFVNRTDVKVFLEAAVELRFLTPAELRKYNVRVPLEHNTRTTCLLEKHEFRKNGQGTRVPEDLNSFRYAGRAENYFENYSSDDVNDDRSITPSIPDSLDNSKEIIPINSISTYLGSNNKKPVGDELDYNNDSVIDSINVFLQKDILVKVPCDKNDSAKIVELSDDVLTDQNTTPTEQTTDQLIETLDEFCNTVSQEIVIQSGDPPELNNEELPVKTLPEDKDYLKSKEHLEEIHDPETEPMDVQEVVNIKEQENSVFLVPKIIPEANLQQNDFELQLSVEQSGSKPQITEITSLEQEKNSEIQETNDQCVEQESQQQNIEEVTQNNQIEEQKISTVEHIEPCESTKAIIETIHEIAISLTSKEMDRNKKLKTLKKLLSTIISKDNSPEKEDALDDDDKVIDDNVVNCDKSDTSLQAIAIQTDLNSIPGTSKEIENSTCVSSGIPLQGIAIQTETTINSHEDSTKIANVVGDKLILDMSKFNNTEFDVQAIKDAVNRQNGKFNEEAVVKVLVEISSTKNQLSAEPLQEDLIECLSGGSNLNQKIAEVNEVDIEKDAEKECVEEIQEKSAEKNDFEKIVEKKTENIDNKIAGNLEKVPEKQIEKIVTITEKNGNNLEIITEIKNAKKTTQVNNEQSSVETECINSVETSPLIKSGEVTSGDVNKIIASHPYLAQLFNTRLKEDLKNKTKHDILSSKNSNILSKYKGLAKVHKTSEKSKKPHLKSKDLFKPTEKPLHNVTKLHENLTKKITSGKHDKSDAICKKPRLKSLFGDSDDDDDGDDDEEEVAKEGVSTNEPKLETHEKHKNPSKTYDDSYLAKAPQEVKRRNSYFENKTHDKQSELSNFKSYTMQKTSDKKAVVKSGVDEHIKELTEGKSHGPKKISGHKRRHSGTHSKEEFKYKLPDDSKYKQIYSKFGDLMPIEQPSVKLVDYLATKKENTSSKDSLFKTVISKDKLKHQKHKHKHLYKLLKFEKSHHKHHKPESLATLSRNSLKSHKARRKSIDKIEETSHKVTAIEDTKIRIVKADSDQLASSPYKFSENNEKLFGQLTDYRNEDVLDFRKELKNRRKSVEQKESITKIYDTSDTETADTESVASLVTPISLKKQQCLNQVYNKNRHKSTETRIMPLDLPSTSQDQYRGKKRGNQGSKKRRKGNEDPLYRAQCTTIQQATKACPYGTRQHWDLREYTMNQVIDIGRKVVLEPAQSTSSATVVYHRNSYVTSRDNIRRDYERAERRRTTVLKGPDVENYAKNDLNNRNFTELIGHESDDELVIERNNQEGIANEETVADEGIADETISNKIIPNEIIANETIADETVARETIVRETVAEETIVEETIAEETPSNIEPNDSASNQIFDDVHIDVEGTSDDDSSRDLVICSDESRMSDTENSNDQTHSFNTNATNEESNVSPLLFNSRFYLPERPANRAANEMEALCAQIETENQQRLLRKVSVSGTPSVIYVHHPVASQRNVEMENNIENDIERFCREQVPGPSRQCDNERRFVHQEPIAVPSTVEMPESANDNSVEGAEQDGGESKRKLECESDDEAICWRLLKNRKSLPPKKRCKVSSPSNPPESSHPIPRQDMQNIGSDISETVSADEILRESQRKHLHDHQHEHLHEHEHIDENQHEHLRENQHQHLHDNQYKHLHVNQHEAVNENLIEPQDVTLATVIDTESHQQEYFRLHYLPEQSTSASGPSHVDVPVVTEPSDDDETRLLHAQQPLLLNTSNILPYPNVINVNELRSRSELQHSTVFYPIPQPSSSAATSNIIDTSIPRVHYEREQALSYKCPPCPPAGLPSYSQIFGNFSAASSFAQPSTSQGTSIEPTRPMDMEDPIQIMDDGSYRVSLTEEKVLRGEINSMLRSEKNAAYIMAVLSGSKDSVACPFDFDEAEDMQVADFETVCNYVLRVIAHECLQKCYVKKGNEPNRPKKNNSLSENGSYTAVKGLNCASAMIYRRLLVKCLRRLRPVFKTPAERKQMPFQLQPPRKPPPLIQQELLESSLPESGEVSAIEPRPLPMEPPPPYSPSATMPPPSPVSQNIVVKFINPFMNPSPPYSVPEIHVKLETGNCKQRSNKAARRRNCTLRIT